MAPTRATPRRLKRALFILAICLLAGGLGLALVASSPASAQADLSGFDLTGDTSTVNSNVSDVTLDATLAYEFDVYDATQVKKALYVGQTQSSATMVDWRIDQDPPTTDDGTLDLAGSLTGADDFTIEDFRPEPGDTDSVEVWVGVVLEIDRANGAPVTASAWDSELVEVTREGTVSVAVGGEGSIQIET